ncbi:MAG: LptF/LptG family permease [Bacteroidia bacterium]
MIKKVDLYIIRKFLVTYFFIILLISLVAVVFDASEKIDKYISAGLSFTQILKFYFGNFVPFLINLVSPLFIFTAALIFTSRMAYNSEIVALFASGVSFWRLLVPYMVVALILTGADLYFKNYIMPSANKGLVEFETKYLRRGNFNPNINIHRKISDTEFFSLERYHYNDSMGTRFALEYFDGLELTGKIMSTYLRWDASKKKWYAHHYQRRTFDGRQQTIDSGDTLYLELPIKPREFTKQQLSVTLMQTPQLIDFIEEETKTGNPDLKFFKVELHQRLGVPFASFILIMIAYSLASRRVRGGFGMHLALGLLITFSFILMMRFTLTFGQQSNLNPMAAVWIPNLFFLGIAIWLLIRAPK